MSKILLEYYFAVMLQIKKNMCRKTIEIVETVYNYKKSIHIDSLNNTYYISYLKKQHVLLYSKKNTTGQCCC